MDRRRFLASMAAGAAISLIDPLARRAAFASGASSSANGERFASIVPTVLTQEVDRADYRAGFSPDGKTILFQRQSGLPNGPTTLYSMPADGSAPPAPVQLVGGPQDMTRPDWSRTRSRFEIAYTSGPDIKLLDYATGETRTVLTGDASAHKIYSYPSWFPDGRALSVTNYYDSADATGCQPISTKPHLVSAHLAGTAEATVTRLTRGHYDPAVAPVGRNIWTGMSSVAQVPSSPSDRRPLIAFAGERPSSGGYCQNVNQVWIRHPSGDVRLINPDQPATEQEARAPWWSPDGRLIVFESDRNPSGGAPVKFQLFVQSPFHPRQIAQITPGEPWAANHAKWSPDGKKIVFSYLNADLGKTGEDWGLALLDLGPLLKGWS